MDTSVLMISPIPSMENESQDILCSLSSISFSKTEVSPSMMSYRSMLSEKTTSTSMLSDKTTSMSMLSERTTSMSMLSDCSLCPSPPPNPCCEDILENIVIGDCNDAKDPEFLQQNSIGAILDCTSELAPNEKAQSIAYFKLPLRDDVQEKLDWEIFSSAFSHIDCHSRNARVLVHCTMGRSRSPTVVMLYLIYRTKCSLAEAFMAVLSIRPQTTPNLRFINQMIDMELQFHQSNSVNIHFFTACIFCARSYTHKSTFMCCASSCCCIDCIKSYENDLCPQCRFLQSSEDWN